MTSPDRFTPPALPEFFVGKATAMLQGMLVDLPLAIGHELASFANRRMQAQGDHMSELLACRSTREIWDSQSRFVTATVTDYGNEASWIAGKMRNAMTAERHGEPPVPAAPAAPVDEPAPLRRQARG